MQAPPTDPRTKKKGGGRELEGREGRWVRHNLLREEKNGYRDGGGDKQYPLWPSLMKNTNFFFCLFGASLLYVDFFTFVYLKNNNLKTKTNKKLVVLTTFGDWASQKYA